MDHEHHYVILNDSNFDTEVKNFPGVVMVDFWAEWCTPCKAIAPFIEELAAKYNGTANVKVGKLDTDSNTQTAMNYQIMSIPTIKFFVKGEIVDELNGFMGPATGEILEDKLKAAVERLS